MVETKRKKHIIAIVVVFYIVNNWSRCFCKNVTSSSLMIERNVCNYYSFSFKYILCLWFRYSAYVTIGERGRLSVSLSLGISKYLGRAHTFVRGQIDRLCIRVVIPSYDMSNPPQILKCSLFPEPGYLYFSY